MPLLSPWPPPASAPPGGVRGPAVSTLAAVADMGAGTAVAVTAAVLAPLAVAAQHARALLQEGRLLEALALPDAARYRYERLLAFHPESAPAELASARLASLATPPGTEPR